VHLQHGFVFLSSSETFLVTIIKKCFMLLFFCYTCCLRLKCNRCPIFTCFGDFTSKHSAPLKILVPSTPPPVRNFRRRRTGFCVLLFCACGAMRQRCHTSSLAAADHGPSCSWKMPGNLPGNLAWKKTCDARTFPGLFSRLLSHDHGS